MKFLSTATFAAGLFMLAASPFTSALASADSVQTDQPATAKVSSASVQVATDTAASTAHALLNFAAKSDGLYLNGAKFFIKGANYFGMEGDIISPHGLWGGDNSTTLAKLAAILKAKNFNAVRLTLAVDAVLENKVVDLNMVKNEAQLVSAYSNDAKPLRYLELLDHVVDQFAQQKILVLLNAHMLVAGKGISTLWYTSAADVNWLEDSWKILAARYANAWNVIGADLKNEPHGEATWGSNKNATDWRLASLKMATSIHRIASRWLIFVEGMDKSSRDDPGFPCFWGENLMDVKNAPLKLGVAERLVYSPHVYGPDVADMSYFHAAKYPSNLPAIWDAHFGYIVGDGSKYGGPMVVGEWGGKYRSDADIKWQNTFAQYLKDKSLGFFYWALNPNAGDTEGLLENDWSTPRADKVDKLLASFVGSVVP